MIFLLIIIIVFIFFCISYKCLGKIESSLKNTLNIENYSNINKNIYKNDRDECKTIQNKYNNFLTTPVAVNSPNQEFQHKFFIGELINNNNNNYNYDSDYVNYDKNKICLPVKQLKYDAVWTGNKKLDNNDFQKINWNNKKKIVKFNCSNNLIIKPNKIIRPGQTIVNLYPEPLNNEIIRYFNIRNFCVNQPDVISSR